MHADQRLTPCDVPLAVFQSQSNTLRFVDMWAVRRSVVSGPASAGVLK